MFLELYRLQSEAVLRFFVRRVLDPRAAADLTAETFAEAFSGRAGFDAQRGTASQWLFGIANRRLSRYFETLSLERACRDRLGITPDDLSNDDYDRIEEMIDFEAIGRRVRSALEVLARDQREAIMQRVVDGASYREIAIDQGCSELAARARVSRGLRTLAALLSNPKEEGAAS